MHPHGHHPIPPVVILRDIHSDLLPKYDCKDSVTPPTLPGERTRTGYDSKDGVSQEQEDVPLFLPNLDRFYEANFWGEDASNPVVILNTGSRRKSSHGDSRLKTSRGYLWFRVALNKFAFTRSNT